VFFVDKKEHEAEPAGGDPLGSQSDTKGMAAALTYLIKQGELKEAEAKKKAEWWARAKMTGMVIGGAVGIGLLGYAMYKKL